MCLATPGRLSLQNGGSPATRRRAPGSFPIGWEPLRVHDRRNRDAESDRKVPHSSDAFGT